MDIRVVIPLPMLSTGKTTPGFPLPKSWENITTDLGLLYHCGLDSIRFMLRPESDRN